MLSGSTNAMLQSAFHEAVVVAFQVGAEEDDDGVEKALFKPGIAGVHVFLEGCRRETPCSEITKK